MLARLPAGRRSLSQGIEPCMGSGSRSRVPWIVSVTSSRVV